MKKFCSSTFLFCILSFFSNSQDISLQGDSTFVQCGGVFTDEGGLSDYSGSVPGNMSICSGNGVDAIQLDFSVFNLNPGDELIIFDGPDNSFPQLAGSPFTTTNSPGIIVSTSSCLTFDFNAAWNSSGEGWEADISCRSLTNGCLANYSLEIDPVPDNGVCGVSLDYQYCFTVLEWNNLGSPNAFHGFEIILTGSGFVSGIIPTQMPASCDGNGQWGFYNAGSVLSDGTGNTFGPGFFYEADAGLGLDAQPGNNPGDQCIPPGGLTFCFELTTEYCEYPYMGNQTFESANVELNILSDGESGMFNSPLCEDDISPELNLLVGCVEAECDPCFQCPTLLEGGGTFCAGTPITPINWSYPPSFEPCTMTITDASGTQIFNSSDGSYFPTVFEGLNNIQFEFEANGFCSELTTGEFTYAILTPPEAILYEDTTLCIGQPVPITFEVFNFFGAVPGEEYTIHYNDPLFGPNTVALDFSNTIQDVLVNQVGDYEIFQVDVSLDDVVCTSYPFGPSVTVEEGEIPEMTLSGDTLVCPEEIVVLEIEFIGDENFVVDLYYNGIYFETINEMNPGIYTYPFSFSEPGVVTAQDFMDSQCLGLVQGDATIQMYEFGAEISGGELGLCIGDSAEINFELEGQFMPWTFEYFLNGLSQSDLVIDTASYTLNAYEEGTFLFTSVSDGMCELSMFELIEVGYQDSLLATFLEDITICQGSSDFLQIDFSIPLGLFEIEYSIDGILQPSILTFNNPYFLEVNQEGVYAIESIFIDGDCAGFPQNTANVTVVAPPSASMDSTLTICPDVTGFVELELTGNGPWVLSYEYNSMPGILDTIFAIPASFPVGGEGTYVITGIEDAVCEGTFNGQADVSLFQLPELSIEADEVICSNSLTQLDLTATGQGPFDIEIELNGMAFGSFNSPDGQFSIPINLAGNYEVVSISDLNCSVIENQSYNLSYFDAPAIYATTDTTLCINDEVSFSGSAQGGFGGPFNYWWVVEGDTINSDNFSYEFSQEQNFEFLVDDGCGIYYSQDLAVDLFPFPSFEFLSFDDLLCGAQTITADTDIPLSTIGETCTWIVDGVSYDNCGPLDASVLNTGTFDIELIVESVDGCSTQNVVENAFTIYPVTESEFTYSPKEPTVLNDLVNFYSNSPDAVVHSWLLNNEFEFSNERNSTYKLEGLQGQQWTVCYAIENEFACPDTSCSELTIKGDLTIWMPNSFTPNSDGVNDGIRPIIIGADPSQYQFKIWNRWGEVVYETEEMEGAWNGSGKDDPDYYADGETFIWQVIAKPTDQPDFEEFKGSLTLVR